MPRFDHHSIFDHRLDDRIVQKEYLRFSEQDTAEDFAIAQYRTDFIPRSVVKGFTGLHMILENHHNIRHPHEVFYVDSVPEEG